MAFYRSNPIPSLESPAWPRRDILPESPPHTAFNPENVCWSGFSPLYLGERVKNGLRSVLQPPSPKLSSSSSGSSDESLPEATLDQLEQTFSPIGSSTDARIYLTQTSFDMGPSTVVWAFPEAKWGQWPCYSFSYCISVMTERDANTVYVVDESKSEADPKEPLPPVYECTLDGVTHLWLIVPNRPSADGVVQLSEEQMRAAVVFYDRANLRSLSLGFGAADTVKVKKDKVVDPYDTSREDGDDDDGYQHYYHAGAGRVLLSSADGNEVDAVALAVLLLTHHHSRFDSDSDYHSRGRHDRRFRHAVTARELGPHGVGSYTAYQASQDIEEDSRVSHVWKGLLEWQDVERVQATLLSCACD